MMKKSLPCCVHMALKTLFSCTMYKLPSEEACMDYQYWFQTLVFLETHSAECSQPRAAADGVSREVALLECEEVGE